MSEAQHTQFDGSHAHHLLNMLAINTVASLGSATFLGLSIGSDNEAGIIANGATLAVNAALAFRNWEKAQDELADTIDRPGPSDSGPTMVH